MSAAAPRNVARFLEWDTQFFGVRIATIELEDCTAEEWRAALEFCRAESIRCLYVLADEAADDQLARDAGAKRTDLRLTFERRPPAQPEDRAPSGRIRLALEADIPALRALAARSHGDSRFYADGRFARERCDELYATWIEKSVRGWADAVFTSGPVGAPLCYLTYHRREWLAEIGLVAVAEASRGQGLGRELVQAALLQPLPRLMPIQVVTQERNEAATALYTACGFELRRFQPWYHLWFDDRP